MRLTYLLLALAIAWKSCNRRKTWLHYRRCRRGPRLLDQAPQRGRGANREQLDEARRRTAAAAITNVDIIQGDADNPKLLPASLDAVFVIDSYHDMTKPQAMLKHMLEALRPDGRLVMIEQIGKDLTLSRDEQVRKHLLSPQLVERELVDSGFEILDRRANYLDPVEPGSNVSACSSDQVTIQSDNLLGRS